MEIHAARDDDWAGIWSIVAEVLAEGDAYTYEPDMTEDQARGKWLPPPPWRTRVAVDGDQVLGAATWGPNQSGPGSHISNANFIVSSKARGRGVGTALVEDTFARARAEGYAGMQFNAVTETNPPWRCTSGSASRSSAPCPEPSSTRRRARSACT